MSNPTYFPPQDGFETTLSQELSSSGTTIYINDVPSYTPTNTQTLITINPGKTNMEVIAISNYSSGGKTLTVGTRAMPITYGVSATAQTHAQGSKVIISDNFKFWYDMFAAFQGKVNTNSSNTDTGYFADAAARDAYFTSPVNGNTAYLLAEGKWTDYVAGAWADRASGTNPNASTTVAGKVEIATDAEVTAGTATGGTGAILVLTPEQQKKSISLKGAGTIFGDADEIAVNISGEDKRITGANLRESIPASTTAKGTVELATDNEATTGTDTTRYLTPNSGRLALGAIEPGTTNTYLEANTERTSSNTSMTMVKEFQTKRTGYFTVSFDLKASVSASAVNARIYINGVAVGTNRTSTSTSYVTYSENFQVKYNDLIQLYYQTVAGTNAIVRNFNMKYDLISGMTAGVINND